MRTGCCDQAPPPWGVALRDNAQPVNVLGRTRLQQTYDSPQCYLVLDVLSVHSAADGRFRLSWYKSVGTIKAEPESMAKSTRNVLGESFIRVVT